MSPRPEAGLRPVVIETDLITLMGVHGYLCLALRHPQMTGLSRDMVLGFVQAAGRKLVEGGILTEAELAQAQRVEAEESPHGFARSGM